MTYALLRTRGRCDFNHQLILESRYMFILTLTFGTDQRTKPKHHAESFRAELRKSHFSRKTGNILH